jgi:hypothetical protein
MKLQYKEDEGMKKLFLFILCLFFVAGSAQAGAGGNSAKQDGQLWQAGESSIYFYDVEPGDTHGDGKLMIDLDKHTFVFNGQGFLPSAQLALQSRAADSTDFVVFAKGKATPSGNLHIAGTWAAAAPPAAVLLDYQEIVGFWLKNDGYFTAKTAFRYSTDGGTTWTLSSDTSDPIYGGDDRQSQYYIHDVPYNALIKLKAEVVWGDDKSASEVFRAVPSTCWGYYTISGTTQNVKLSYTGRVCFE